MSCDAELQELMVQVDRVVDERRAEWQDKLQNTEHKLQSTLQENYSLKSVIEDKNIEIENLKSQNTVRDSGSIITDYDQEVLQLRFELSQIKKSYEKYHHKYIKKAKEIEKEKEELFLEKNELSKQVNYLKCQEKQWSQEHNKHRIELEEIEMKRNEVISDRSMLTEQLSIIKKNFSEQLETFSKSEQKYNKNLRELEIQLQESKKSLQKEIEDNRNELCELMQHTKKITEEKQQVINDNESAKRMIIRLEQELGKVMSENKVKDKSIFKMEQIIKISEKAINEKNEVLKALRLNSSSKDYSHQISKLENELSDVKSDLKMSLKNEKSLQYEVLTLGNKLKEAQEWMDSEENSKKQVEINIKEISKLEDDKSHLTKQMEKLKEMVENKSAEMNNARSNIECLTLENESLKQRINQELLFKKKNGDKSLPFWTSVPKERVSNVDYNTNHIQATLNNIDKERSDLLQFCQDKDMVIQRLQMENRILQEFITKLNFGIADDNPSFTSQTFFNDYETVSNVFQPLKETLIDYNEDSSDFNKSTNSNDKSKIESVKSLKLKSSEVTSLRNGSQSNQSGDNILFRSSEEFLSLLAHSDESNVKHHAKDSYLTLYPILSAAKYFTNEREQSKEIEEVIDQQLTQLRKESSKRCNMPNF